MRFFSGVCDILSFKDQQHFAIFCNRARKEQGKGGRRLGASAPDESAARIAWRGKRGGNVMKVSIRPSRVTLMIGSASAALMLGFASTAHAQARGDAASTQASDTATADAGGDIVVRGFRASVFDSIAAKRQSPILLAGVSAEAIAGRSHV